MATQGIVKVQSAEIPIPEGPVVLVGDPGCDGLGAATMSIFARALQVAGTGPTIVLGDVVHRGIPSLYSSVCTFLETVSRGPVFMLCGNHDTARYEEWFGQRNYLLYNDRDCYIVLDDSGRAFTPDALAFLENSLHRYGNRRLVILFHIPPPNPVGSNTISAHEWSRLKALLEPWRTQVSFIACGHVHSFYMTEVDGYPLVVSGGGGARIEYVSDKVLPENAVHHVIRVIEGEQGCLEPLCVPLATVAYDRELGDSRLVTSLQTALYEEMHAHLQYLIHAEEAAASGYPGFSAMFRAFADAEYHHARNHWHALGNMTDLESALRKSIQNEAHEVGVMYAGFHEYATRQGHGLAAYSFLDALEAEKVHHHIARSALAALEEGRDVPVTTYRTCTSCGYTFQGEGQPAHCPICGAPGDKIHQVP